MLFQDLYMLLIRLKTCCSCVNTQRTDLQSFHPHFICLFILSINQSNMCIKCAQPASESSFFEKQCLRFACEQTHTKRFLSCADVRPIIKWCDSTLPGASCSNTNLMKCVETCQTPKNARVWDLDLPIGASWIWWIVAAFPPLPLSFFFYSHVN